MGNTGESGQIRSCRDAGDSNRSGLSQGNSSTINRHNEVIGAVRQAADGRTGTSQTVGYRIER